MVLLETPSRLWRRIEANKQNDMDMPSLPSLPEEDDSQLSGSTTTPDEPVLIASVSPKPPSLNRDSLESFTVPSTMKAIGRVNPLTSKASLSSHTQGEFDAPEQTESLRTSALSQQEGLNTTSASSAEPFTPKPCAEGGLFNRIPPSKRASDAFPQAFTNLATPGPRRTQFLLDVINTGARPKHDNLSGRAGLARAPYTPAFIGRSSFEPSDTPINPPSRIRRMPKASTPYVRVTASEEMTPSSQTSFISVASSHDLLMPHLPNQNPHNSFDPAVARHGDGGAVSRFDAPRLNSYLHTLNTQLAKENCYLVDVVLSMKRYIEGDSQVEVPDLSQLAHLPPNQNLEERLKQIQDAERSNQISYPMQVEEQINEALSKARLEWEDAKLELLKEHEEECQALIEAREKDSAQWQQRIKKASEDAEEILLQIEREKDDALKRLQFAEATLKETSGDAMLTITDLERAIRAREDKIRELEHEVMVFRDEHSIAIHHAGGERAEMQREYETQILNLKTQLLRQTEDIEAKNHAIHNLKEDMHQAELLRDELEECQHALAKHEEQHQQDIQTLEEEIARLKNRPPPSMMPTTSQVDHLAKEEIARLEEENGSLWKQIKDAKAKLEAKTMEIDRLQDNSSELQRHVDELRDRLEKLNKIGEETLAPSGHTPVMNHRSFTFKIPKTPGGPLKDISWINNTTHMVDNGELIRQIQELDMRLGDANRTIEAKMRALDEQGLAAVESSSKLKEINRELQAAQKEIEAFRERERNLITKEREADQNESEAKAESERIKKDLEKLQTRISDVEMERNEAQREMRDLQSQARLDRLEREQWRSIQVETDDRLRELFKKVDEGDALVEQLRSEKHVLERKLSKFQLRADEDVKEIEELRERVHSAHSEVLKSQKALNEMRRLKEREESGVPDLVAKLRVSLQQVQQDADEFRDDLARLREDKQVTEEVHRQEIADLQERFKESNRGHGNKQDDQRHKDECKGLLVQINYLQAKWYRESAFRSDLQFTKRYLLSLYGATQGHRRGIPLTSFPPLKSSRTRRLRSAAMTILFTVRIKRAADSWRNRRKCRSAIELALGEMHQRRTGRTLETTT